MKSKALFVFGFLVFALILGAKQGAVSRRSDQLTDLCLRVHDQLFFQSEKTNQWRSECLNQVPAWARLDAESLVSEIQKMFFQLGVSHLDVYPKKQENFIFEGIAKKNGLKVRWIETGYFVVDVLPSSPAEDVGMRKGDRILHLGEDSGLSVSAIESYQGRMKVRRGGNEIEVDVGVEAISDDVPLQVQPICRGAGYLRVSSFRAGLFELKSFDPVVKDILKYKEVVVDLRDNRGGNLVAMTRLMSALTCRTDDLGAFRKTYKKGDPKYMPNDLSSESQLEVLEASQMLVMKRYSDIPCREGLKVVLLVNEYTASAAEILAASLGFTGATVAGSPTSGEVVLAVYYSLDELIPGLLEGYGISLPEFVYVDPEGRSYEGDGLDPVLRLSDDEDLAKRGIDSWIQAYCRG